jgi:hypothetical protein
MYYNSLILYFIYLHNELYGNSLLEQPNIRHSPDTFSGSIIVHLVSLWQSIICTVHYLSFNFNVDSFYVFICALIQNLVAIILKYLCLFLYCLMFDVIKKKKRLIIGNY